MNTLERALQRRADDGDQIAGGKLGVATVAADRLDDIRAAMLRRRPD